MIKEPQKQNKNEKTRDFSSFNDDSQFYDSLSPQQLGYGPPHAHSPEADIIKIKKQLQTHRHKRAPDWVALEALSHHLHKLRQLDLSR